MVVRIRSRQTLELLPDEFADVEDNTRPKNVLTDRPSDFEPVVEDEKEVTENFVIQKRFWNGKDEEWMVWGTVEETPFEKLPSTFNPQPEKE